MDDTPRRSALPRILFLVLGVVTACHREEPPYKEDGTKTPTLTPRLGNVVTSTQTPTPEPTCVPTWTTPGAHQVRVGQDPCDVKPWCVPIGAKDTIQWVLANPTPNQKLLIEFTGNSPFPVVTQGPHGGQVGCTGTGCSSGAVILPNPTPRPGETLGYKYWQTVVDPNGNQRACDGRIIIKW
jgi:hypothetical protein